MEGTPNKGGTCRVLSVLLPVIQRLERALDDAQVSYNFRWPLAKKRTATVDALTVK